MIKSLLLAGILLFAARPEPIKVITYAVVVQYCVVTDLRPIERKPAVIGLDTPLDGIYALPSQAQINKINHSIRERKQTYVDDAHDCDDMALEYYVNARQLARKIFPSGNSALAVGVIFVKIDGPVPDLGIDWKLMRPAYHALNVFLREDGTWIVVEPQNGAMAYWKSIYYEGNLTVMSILI